MNDTFDLRVGGESHIEVHKFRTGAIVAVTLAALVLQALSPIYVPKAALLDLPLLVTLYFGLSRRSPASGLTLGMIIGLLQDSLSKSPLGIYGIAKTLVGYVASSIGGRLDTEHPLSRFALTIVFFGLHQGVVVLIKRLLLAQPEVWFTPKLGIAAAVNGVVAVGLFLLLDRLRKSS